MKLLIFGASGNTGKEVVKQALEQGHNVTAFVRNPEKLDITHPHLSFFQGDVMDIVSVQKAVQGQEAVLCLLGAGKKLSGNIRSEGTRNIIQAMEQAGIQRLICQSTLGAGDSWGSLNLYWKYIMFGLLLKNVLADHEHQEKIIRASSLNWTIVRPGSLLDGEKTGEYRYGFPGSDNTSQLQITRADVADFILKQLTDNTYVGKAPSLSY
ncbi:MAG: SDR family oxidoreductase [Sphaerospermopsis sp. SIO1G2]|nr:SDR family oxidoreductase [Sphaerospermopsis sp. SIO1G1]NET70783.1 SDR family oxidoreductase [Sphaerospermopsis sp. SIO1G2]